MPAVPSEPLHLKVLEIASALLGIAGTFLMSRRYMGGLARSVFAAFVAPLVLMFNRSFLDNQMNANKDVPVSRVGMVLGLSLLTWAFAIQLLLAFLK